MIGYTGNVPPSTGLGNIMPASGQPNAPGAAMMINDPRPQLRGAQPAAQPPAASFAPQIGNMPMQRPEASQLPGASQANAQPANGQFSQLMSQLHPNTMNALRGIPPEALQQLHQAGLIHPGLMQHLGGMRAGGQSNMRPEQF